MLQTFASFPGSSPAFCHIQYSMRQKVGEEPGKEASKRSTSAFSLFAFTNYASINLLIVNRPITAYLENM